MTPDVVRAHRHSSRHLAEVAASDICGCFYCLAVFEPSEVKEWTDNPKDGGAGQTALCPRCGVDSVIGSESGYPVTTEFLRAMSDIWFGTPIAAPDGGST